MAATPNYPLLESGARPIFGYAAEEAEGRSLDLIIPERLRERHWHGFRQVAVTGQSRYGEADVLAVPALRKDGDTISIEFTIVRSSPMAA